MFVGVRIGPEATFPPELLKQAGATMVSITPRPDRDIRSYLLRTRALNLAPHLVLDREALGGRGWLGRAPDILAGYAADYGALCTYWSAVNEADDHGVESSYMNPADLSYILALLRGFLPSAYIIAGGFSTGQPDYVEQVDLSPASAISCHPYGQRPDDAVDWSWVPGNFGLDDDLIGNYRRFGLPLWADEIGVDVADEVRQGDYCRAILLSLHGLGMVGVVWFHAQDWDNTHYGLYTADMQPKATLAAFADAAATINRLEPPSPWVPPGPEPVPSGPWIGDGLLRGLAATGWTPVRGVGEVHWPVVRCQGDNLLVWDPEQGRVYRVPNLGKRVVA